MKLFRLGTLLAAAALVFAPVAANADQIRIAIQPIPQYAPIFVAKQKKWLDEELAKAGSPTIKWASFAAGPPINEAFAAGQQDIGFLGDTPALIGKSAGIDTRIVGITASGPKSLAVVVAAGSPIKAAKDLKGRKVAVTKGSYAQHLLALVLEQGGLTFKDIELINLPNGEVPTALIAGNIDAGAVWDPVLAKYEAEKALRVLADGTGIKAGVLVIIASGEFATSKRDQVKALLKAYDRGAEYIKSNPREAARLIGEDVKLAPELVEQVLAKLDFNAAIHDHDVDEIKKTEAYLRQIALTKVAVDVERFADRTLGREGGLK